MFSAIWKLTLRTAVLIDRYAPTNRLLRRLMSREPTRWPALAIWWGIGFIAAAIAVAVAVYYWLPEPWYLLFFLLLYDGGKFIAYALRGYAALRLANREATRAVRR